MSKTHRLIEFLTGGFSLFQAEFPQKPHVWRSFKPPEKLRFSTLCSWYAHESSEQNQEAHLDEFNRWLPWPKHTRGDSQGFFFAREMKLISAASCRIRPPSTAWPLNGNAPHKMVHESQERCIKSGDVALPENVQFSSSQRGPLAIA